MENVEYIFKAFFKTFTFTKPYRYLNDVGVYSVLKKKVLRKTRKKLDHDNFFTGFC